MQRRTLGDFDAECLRALAAASTHRTADILLDQSSGLLRSAFEELLECGGEWGSPETSNAIHQRLADLRSWAGFGLQLSEPWNVVLAGRPNVGKSSLMNALAGFTRSIVYDQPGTTRDVVTVETAFDGWPVQLADTAGLRAEAGELELAGIDLARARFKRANCRLLLIDTSEPSQPDDRRLLSDGPDAIVVAHKCDLPCAWESPLPDGAIPVSSLTGVGIDRLISAVVEKLVPDVPPPGTPIPISIRQMEALDDAHRAAVRGDWETFRAVIEVCLDC
jgi:tRNA modification GTPase